MWKSIYFKLVLLICTIEITYAVDKWPAHADVNDEATYDYIIVGAGTAGCILANRLTQDKNVTVLAVEAGGDPPEDTDIISLFTLGVTPQLYWDFKTEDTVYTNTGMATGKVLGGSSTINYLYYSRGDPSDYDAWVNTIGDESWSHKNLLPYFKKSENLKDADILNSPTGQYHGNTGEVGITRELSESTHIYLEAFQELGHKIVNDLNGEHDVGFTEPMLYLSKGVRQSSAESFLKPIRERPNLNVMKNTLANKILFDDNKNAIGVEVTKPDGNVIKVLAKKEVIVSAGYINTPKLLLLSGIGPRSHLENMGIKVLSDLPVGENYQDHLDLPLVHRMGETLETFKRDKTQFPAPTFMGLGAKDKSQLFPDYHTYSIVSRNNPIAIQLLCSSVFKLSDTTCTELAKAAVGREILLTAFSSEHYKSRGRVQLRSTNPADPPKIFTGLMADPNDLDNLVESIQDFINVTNSSYFRRVGAETIVLQSINCDGLEALSKEYWKCYVKNVMTSLTLGCCTTSMGTVLDSSLKVRGVNNLRVVDASVMPNIVSSGTHAAVMAIAEKAADIIKQGS